MAHVDLAPWPGFGLMDTVDMPNVQGAINTANRATYMRVPVGGTISKIRMFVFVQSGNICVGVYRNNGLSGPAAAPAAQAATSGSVPCPTGDAAVSLLAPVTVAPGDWLAISADNTTAAFVGVSGIFAGQLWAGRAAYQDTAFPLPATAASTPGIIQGIGLRGIP